MNDSNKKIIKITADATFIVLLFASFVFYLFVGTRWIVEIFKLLNKQSECLKNLKCSDVNKLCKSGSNNELAQYEDIDRVIMREHCGVESLYKMISVTFLWFIPLLYAELSLLSICIGYCFKKIRQRNASRPSDVEAQAFVSNERPPATAPDRDTYQYSDSSPRPPATAPHRYTDQYSSPPPAYQDLDKDPKPPSYESLFDNKQKRHNANSA